MIDWLNMEGLKCVLNACELCECVLEHFMLCSTSLKVSFRSLKTWHWGSCVAHPDTSSCPPAENAQERTGADWPVRVCSSSILQAAGEKRLKLQSQNVSVSRIDLMPTELAFLFWLFYYTLSHTHKNLCIRPVALDCFSKIPFTKGSGNSPRSRDPPVEKGCVGQSVVSGAMSAICIANQHCNGCDRPRDTEGCVACMQGRMDVWRWKKCGFTSRGDGDGPDLQETVLPTGRQSKVHSSVIWKPRKKKKKSKNTSRYITCWKRAAGQKRLFMMYRTWHWVLLWHRVACSLAVCLSHCHAWYSDHETRFCNLCCVSQW